MCDVLGGGEFELPQPVQEAGAREVGEVCLVDRPVAIVGGVVEALAIMKSIERTTLVSMMASPT